MRNKTLRKISVLLLSLTMVMTSMNLSFAAGEGGVSAGEQPGVTQNVEPTKDGEGAPSTDSGTLKEEGVQEDSLEQAIEDTSDAAKVQAKPKKSFMLGDGNEITVDKTVTYNGKMQSLIDVESYYAINPKATRKVYREENDSNWHYLTNGNDGDAKEIVKKKDVGVYTFYVGTQTSKAYRFGDTEDINKIVVEITPAEIDSITLNKNQFFQNTSNEISVREVKAGSLTLQPSEYTIDTKYSDQIKFDEIGNFKLYVNSTSSNFVNKSGSERAYATWSVVAKKSLKNENITINNPQVSWSGNEIDKTPDIVVKDGSDVLVFETDYVFEDDSKNKGRDAGTYTVKIKGIGNYEGTAESTWTIKGTSIGEYNVYFENNTQYFTGSEIEVPSFEVRKYTGVPGFGGHYEYLEKGKDFVVVSGDKGTEAQEYTLRIKGIGGYEGERTGTWKIVKKNVSNLDVSLDNSSFTYDGNVKTPNVTVKDGNNVLIMDEDYTLSGDLSKTVVNNNYHITIAGIGKYEGSITKTWKISKGKAQANVSEIKNLVYTGNPQTLVTASPSVGATVKYYVSDKIFEVSSTNVATIFEALKPSTWGETATGTNAGDYYVYYNLEGGDNWDDEKAIDFDLKDWNIIQNYKRVSIAPKPLTVDEHFTFEVKNQPFDGGEKDTTVTVIDNDRNVTLEQGKDFEVVCDKQTEAGTYTLYINGINNYQGTVSREWKILGVTATLVTNKFLAGNLNRAELESVVADNGTDQTPLIEGTDYEIIPTGTDGTCWTASEKGNYKAKINCIGEYSEFGVVSVDWRVVEPVALKDNFIKFKYAGVERSEIPYSGIEISPEIVIVDGENNVLIEGEDYILGESQRSAVGSGIYTVKILGGTNGFYTGNAEATWKIKGTDISDTKNGYELFLDKNTHYYTGEIITQDYKIRKWEGDRYTGQYIYLTEGEDFEVVSGKEGKDVNTYTLKVKGIGAYEGELSKDWNIAKKDIKDSRVTISNKEYTYDGVTKTPTIVVTFDGIELVENTDYELSGDRSGTDAKSEYKITIKGINCYEGSQDVTWKIKKATPIVTLVDPETGDAPKYTYDGNKKAVQVIVKNGDNIISPTEYDLSSDSTFEGVENAGEYKIQVVMDDTENYNSPAVVKWQIEKRRIAFSFDDSELVYNGDEQYPDLKVEGLLDAGLFTYTVGKPKTGSDDQKNAGSHKSRASVTFADGVDLDWKTSIEFTGYVTQNYKLVGLLKDSSGYYFSGNYNIKQREIEVVWSFGDKLLENGNYEYSGGKQCPIPSIAEGCIVDDAITDKDLNVTIYKGLHTNAEELTAGNIASADVLFSEAGVVNAGEYTAKTSAGSWLNKLATVLKIPGVATSNYIIKDSTELQPFTIEQAEIKSIRFEPPYFSYDGNEKTVEVGSINSRLWPFDFEDDVASCFEIDKDNSVLSATLSGDYRFVLKAIDKAGNNFTGVCDTTWAIRSADLSNYYCKAEDTTYNQETQTPTLIVKPVEDSDVELNNETDYTYQIFEKPADVTVDDLKNDSTEFENTYSAISEPINAGEYLIKITAVPNEDGGNYSGSTWTSWIIKKAPITSVTLDATSIQYDTKAHTVSITSVKAGNPKDSLDVPVDCYTTEGSVFTATDVKRVDGKVDGNVDSYEVVVSANDNNYDGTFTAEWVITPAELVEGDLALRYSNKLKLYIYDGQQKSVKTEVIHRHPTAESVVTLEKSKDYRVVDSNTLSATNAGTYTVTVEGVGNYTGTSSETWQIRGFKTDWLVATLGDYTYTYDGEQHIPRVNVGILETLGLPGLDDGDDYEYVIKNPKGEIIRDKEGNVVEGSSIDAGIYTVEVKGLKYFQDTKELKYEIKQAELKTEWILAGIANDPFDPIEQLDGKNYTNLATQYDIPGIKTGPERTPIGGNLAKLLGLNHAESKIYVNKNGKMTSDGSGLLVEDRDYEIKTPTEERVSNEDGCHELIIEGKGNYTGTAIAVWSIGALFDYGFAISGLEELDAILNTKKFTREYNGKLINAISAMKIRTSNGILDAEDILNPEYCTISGDYEAKDAGTYSFSVQGKGYKDFYGKINVTWTITPRIVVAKWDKTTTEYNGQVQRPQLQFYHVGVSNLEELGDALKILLGNLPEKQDGIVDNYKADAKAISLTKPKNAGTYQMYARLTGDVNLNNYQFYDLNSIPIGNQRVWFTSFEITKKEIGIEWSNTEFTYDGDYHIPTAKATNLVDGDFCTLSTSGRQKNVGEGYKAKATGILFDTKLIGDNYKLPDDEAARETTFKIIGRSIDEALFNAKDTTYNGTEQTPSITAYDVLGILDIRTLRKGTDYEIEKIEPVTETIQDISKDAGEYKVTIKGIGNYSGTTTIDWTIEKARPSYDIDAIDNLVYNAKDQALVKGKTSDGTIEYSVKNSIISALTGLGPWVPEGEATAKNAGTYYVYYKVIGDRNHYDVGADLLHVRVVTIDKAKLTKDMISLEDDEYTYDGRRHSPKIIVKIGDTILPESDYYIYKAFPWSSDLRAVNAGMYHIYITADLYTSGNLYDAGLVIDKPWKINPKPVRIVFDRESLTTTYGDNGRAKAYVQTPASKDRFTLKPILTYTGTSFTGVKYNGTKVPTEAGVYTVTATINDPNYMAKPVKAKFVVKRKSINDGQVNYGSALIYNGEEQTQEVVSVTGVRGKRGRQLDVTFDVAHNSATEPGAYKLVVKGTGNFKGRIVKSFAIAPDTAEGDVYDLGKGSVEMKVTADENVEAKYDIGALIKSLVETGELDAEKLSQIADGEEVILNLTVEDVTGTTEKPQTYDKFKIGQEFKINLKMYMFKDGVPVIEGLEVKETTSTISFKLNLNEAFINTNKDYTRDYVVIREHDGSTSTLSSAYNKNDNSISFSTNKFSYYAVGYMDAKIIIPGVATGDDSNIYLFLMLGLAAAIAGAAAVARRRKEN